MLRKKKEPKPRKRILETLLRDMQGTAAQKVALFEKLSAAGAFANESAADLRQVENTLAGMRKHAARVCRDGEGGLSSTA